MAAQLDVQDLALFNEPIHGAHVAM
jgi:hypothetical protein